MKKHYSEMTIEEAVKTLRIERHGDKIGCRMRPSEQDEILAYMRANKPAIMQYLLEQEEALRRASEEKYNKIHSIPGLDEIEHARADLAAWHDEWEASFDGEGGGGVGVRPQPKYDLAAMYAQYPKAVAYLNAREYSRSENIAKSRAGEIAVKKILDGEDYNAATTEMEAAWTKYCMDHAWD